jgi:glycosyltransferase involved in cell wall biosynthesis
MVIISCSGKFHNFALAEQLHRSNLLSLFYTTYAYQKNSYFKYFTKRVDKEIIPPNLIRTNIPIAILIKSINANFLWNDLFDRWVASDISKVKNFEIFIGWSGMSLQTLIKLKKLNKTTIIERGSSHILFQQKILKEEYKYFGQNFNIDRNVIEKELFEYKISDFISIPSNFVKQSFLDYGIDEKKLIINPYGASSFFNHVPDDSDISEKKFRILYLGTLTIQKGLIYLFKALNLLKIPNNDYEVWFIGKIHDEMKSCINHLKQSNWKFFGQINHYELPKFISKCDLAINPSIQEGLAMVIPQILNCGVPVICTTNTGGQDLIEEGKDGFIISIRSPQQIKEKIEYIYDNPEILKLMKTGLLNNKKDISWDAYGNRYINFINRKLN